MEKIRIFCIGNKLERKFRGLGVDLTKTNAQTFLINMGLLRVGLRKIYFTNDDLSFKKKNEWGNIYLDSNKAIEKLDEKLELYVSKLLGKVIYVKDDGKVKEFIKKLKRIDDNSQGQTYWLTKEFVKKPSVLEKDILAETTDYAAKAFPLVWDLIGNPIGEIGNEIYKAKILINVGSDRWEKVEEWIISWVDKEWVRERVQEIYEYILITYRRKSEIHIFVTRHTNKNKLPYIDHRNEGVELYDETYILGTSI